MARAMALERRRIPKQRSARGLRNVTIVLPVYAVLSPRKVATICGAKTEIDVSNSHETSCKLPGFMRTFRLPSARPLVLGLILALAGCAGDGPPPGGSTTTSTTLGGGGSALTTIQADIFTPTCAILGCHNAITQAGLLNLSDAASAHAGLVNVVSSCASRVRVVPNDPDTSYLLHKLGDGPTPCGSAMPFGATPLTTAELALIRSWILDGASPAAASLETSASTTTSTTSWGSTTSTLETR